MLEKFNLLLVNQTADQIKHQEAWKASRDLDFPIALMKSGRAGENENEHYRSMTMTMRQVMNEGGKTGLVEESIV